MIKTVHLKIYLPLSGKSKHQVQQNVLFTGSWKMKLISMDQQSGHEFT